MQAELVSFENTQAPCIYLIEGAPSPALARFVPAALGVNVVALPVADWRGALTPWPAESLYRGGQAFEGRAAFTLDELCIQLPAIESALNVSPRARGIAGYSLGGLFAAYALTQCDAFSCMASLSGSHWYPGWVDWVAANAPSLEGTQAFFSVGTKEKRAGKPALKRIEENTRAVADALAAHGCTVQVQTGPGGHMDNVEQRVDAGMRALAHFLLDAPRSR